MSPPFLAPPALPPLSSTRFHPVQHRLISSFLCTWGNSGLVPSISDSVRWVSPNQHVLPREGCGRVGGGCESEGTRIQPPRQDFRRPRLSADHLEQGWKLVVALSDSTLSNNKTKTSTDKYYTYVICSLSNTEAPQNTDQGQPGGQAGLGLEAKDSRETKQCSLLL